MILKRDSMKLRNKMKTIVVMRLSISVSSRKQKTEDGKKEQEFSSILYLSSLLSFLSFGASGGNCEPVPGNNTVYDTKEPHSYSRFALVK